MKQSKSGPKNIESRSLPPGKTLIPYRTIVDSGTITRGSDSSSPMKTRFRASSSMKPRADEHANKFDHDLNRSIHTFSEDCHVHRVSWRIQVAQAHIQVPVCGEQGNNDQEWQWYGEDGVCKKPGLSIELPKSL